MNQFIARVANWLANEVIVKSLVKNKSFQNMALRTHLRVEKNKEAVKEAMDEAAQAVEQAHRTGIGEGGAGVKGGIRQPPPTGLGGFIQAFVKEVKKDFGGG